MYFIVYSPRYQKENVPAPDVGWRLQNRSILSKHLGRLPINSQPSAGTVASFTYHPPLRIGYARQNSRKIIAIVGAALKSLRHIVGQAYDYLIFERYSPWSNQIR
jgi:hypothetical protein